VLDRRWVLLTDRLSFDSLTVLFRSAFELVSAHSKLVASLVPCSLCLPDSGLFCSNCLFPLFWFLPFCSVDNTLHINTIGYPGTVVLLSFLCWSDWCTFSSLYLPMINISQWLVRFCHLPLWFLTSKIATIIILEHTGLLYASSSRPTLEQALYKAHNLYAVSGIHDAVTNQFNAPLRDYSISQFTEFILKHRLWLLPLASYYLLFTDLLYHLSMNVFVFVAVHRARYRSIASSLSSSPLSSPRFPLPANSKASRRTRAQSRRSDAAACMSRWKVRSGFDHRVRLTIEARIHLEMSRRLHGHQSPLRQTFTFEKKACLCVLFSCHPNSGMCKDIDLRKCY
jgi:hypothetical protein